MKCMYPLGNIANESINKPKHHSIVLDTFEIVQCNMASTTTKLCSCSKLYVFVVQLKSRLTAVNKTEKYVSLLSWYNLYVNILSKTEFSITI